MARLSAETLINVTVEDIQKQMDKISYILSGRLEEDNIYQSGDINAGIQPKTVTNMADETRPVSGWKIFGSQLDDGFFWKVWQPLKKAKKDAIQPIVLSGECAFVFNNSTMEREEEKKPKEKGLIEEIVGIAEGVTGDVKGAISNVGGAISNVGGKIGGMF